MINELLHKELEELEVEESFKVTDLEGANWCFRKLRALNSKIEENNKTADNEVERIEKWRNIENEKHNDSKRYFEFLITDYYRRLRKEDPKAKLTTPHGKITTRKTKQWNYINEDEILKYLKENNPNLIKTKEEVDKAELKKLYKGGVDQDTGEMVPGIEVIPQETILIKAVD